MIPWWEMGLRLVLAAALSGVIGINREHHEWAAGLRTHMLVCVGAALTMLVSTYGFQDVLGRPAIVLDPSRIGAQVISGIGFIGTGTILVTSRNEVKGLTTASGLWASACMGLAIGAGFYEGMFIGFILILLSMTLLPLVENVVLSGARNMNIYIELDSIENLGGVVNRMKADGLSLYDIEIDREQHGSISQINGLFSVRLPKKQPHTEILAMLSTLDGIIAIDEV